MKSFGSDNHSGIHPDILKAIEKANSDHAVAYGDDPITARVQAIFRDMFGQQCASYLVFNGTGANVLALSALVGRHQAVICPATAHIWTDECGAPERQLGCKLIPVTTPDGKLTPELVAPNLQGFGFQHHSQPGAISISQPTELGTLYTVEEIRALADQAHAHGMRLHVDGARLANAIAAMEVTPRQMITDTGVDALSFGGTKSGMMAGEAVIFPDGNIFPDALYVRKQLMQLSSKMRFVAAQFEAYLSDELWLRLAAHSNAMAGLLSAGAAEIPGVRITRPTQVNGVFAIIPPESTEKLNKDYYFYVWDEATGEVRWMTSFDTTKEEVNGFIEALKCALNN